MNKLIGFIKRILTEYREQIAYLFFGVLTTLISWGVSSALYYFVFGEGYTVLSNVISEAIAITFAYVTNKLFVFRSKTENFKSLLREIVLFYALRVGATVLNVLAMYLLVDLWNCEFWICKIGVNVVVIIVNYLFSKFIIFSRKGKEQTQKSEEIGDEND